MKKFHIQNVHTKLPLIHNKNLIKILWFLAVNILCFNIAEDVNKFTAKIAYTGAPGTNIRFRRR